MSSRSSSVYLDIPRCLLFNPSQPLPQDGTKSAKPISVAVPAHGEELVCVAAPDESVSVLPEDGATPVAGAKDSAPVADSTFEAMADGAVDTAEAAIKAAGEAVATVGVGLQGPDVDATEDKPVVEESLELPACEGPTSEQGALYKQNKAVSIV